MQKARYSYTSTLVFCFAALHCQSNNSQKGKGHSSVAEAPSNTALAKADQTYTVRGKLVRLPAGAGGAHGVGRTIEVQHEAIPDFVNASNEKVGMVAMTMPFNLAPDATLQGFNAGDLITFSFEVRWNSEPQLLITHMSQLPANTQLNLAK